jgi:hypothetical protein
MAAFHSSNLLGGTQQNLSSSYKTLLALTAATATLTAAEVFELAVGVDGTPADNAIQWDLSRQTAAGTSTAVTPNPVNGAKRAAGTVGSANFTAEGTITANSSLWALPLNQRASFRWVAYGPDSELIIPATNLAGLALRAKSASYTSTAVAEMNHRE